MAKTPTPKPAAPPELSRRQQFAQTYQMAKKSDPAIGRWVAGAALAGVMVGFVVFWLIVGRSSTLGLILSIVGALMLGVLAGLVIFSRRAQRAVYGQMEGQAGAAAGALGLLKRGWHVDNAVAFNKQQDIVHRVVGPPGIVLVGEGNPGRLKGLLAAERKRHERVAVDAPVHEVICGNGEGQVPLAKLARTIQKMKRQVKPAEITDILARLRAIDASRPAVPMPKGPLPTSMKGLRGNLRGR
jgi:F0F1-type ATP synthase assembly protein I